MAKATTKKAVAVTVQQERGSLGVPKVNTYLFTGPATRAEVGALATLLSNGYRLECGMQLNAGRFVEGGQFTGKLGVWHHDGKQALKLLTTSCNQAAEELLARAGITVAQD